MSDVLRKKWILAGVIWAAAILLAIWNLQTISGIAAGRQAWDTAKANRIFIAGQQQKMSEIAGQVARLSRPADSPVFGRLAVKEDLERLAASFALLDFKVSDETVPASGASVPMTVSFRGPLATASRWLTAVQAELPFLVVRSVAAERGGQGAAVYTVEFNCRFRSASS